MDGLRCLLDGWPPVGLLSGGRSVSNAEERPSEVSLPWEAVVRWVLVGREPLVRAPVLRPSTLVRDEDEVELVTPESAPRASEEGGWSSPSVQSGGRLLGRLAMVLTTYGLAYGWLHDEDGLPAGGASAAADRVAEEETTVEGAVGAVTAAVLEPAAVATAAADLAVAIAASLR